MKELFLTLAIDTQTRAGASLRKQSAIELVTLAVLTPLFLYFAPRELGLYAAAAVLFFGFVAIRAMKARERIWPRVDVGWADRLRRSAGLMFAVTAPTVVAFYGWCEWTGHEVSYVNLSLAFFLYMPWALLQQTIFVVYLLGRLRAVFPLAPPLLLAAVNGVAYGLVHLPDLRLVIVTMIAGMVWSYAYLRDRHLLPIAVSHAVLGSTFYYFVGQRDLFDDWLTLLNTLL
ncbi:MAG: type II CAAX prenyl endopeptidase Rce1 family protein [Acidiferrobacterales bacterium]